MSTKKGIAQGIGIAGGLISVPIIIGVGLLCLVCSLCVGVSLLGSSDSSDKSVTIKETTQELLQPKNVSE